MTCEQLDTLERQVSELKLCCEGSVANFAAKCPNYNGFLNQLIAVWGNNTGQQDWDSYNFNYDLLSLSHMRQELVNEAYQIVYEHNSKLDGIIIPSVKVVYDYLKILIGDVYQSEHRFAMRSSKFSPKLRSLDENDSQLSRIFTSLKSHQDPDSHFQKLFKKISEIIRGSDPVVQEYANHFNDPQKINILLNPQTYRTDLFFKQLEDLKWPLIKHCLVITQQPPPVVPIDGSRPFSLKLLNVQSLLPDQDHFVVKVCLVSEATAKDIRLNDRIPEYITSFLREDQRGEGGEGRTRNSNYYCGTFFLDGSGQCNGDPNHQVVQEELAPQRTRRVRSTESQDPLVHATGSTVQYLTGNRTLNMKCCCFDRKLVVKGKPIKRAGETQKATDKYVLLVAMEVGIGAEEKRLVWTLSLPFCVTTNSSQYLKAWNAIVWNEAVGEKGTRLDFEIGENADEAPWKKVKTVFEGTFHCLVGQPMMESDLAFVRSKIEETYFVGTGITDDTEICKSNLFDRFEGANRQICASIFTWFFESLSLVQKDSFLHDIYINGHIAGLISIKDCFDQLEEGINDGTAENGSFMVRFSDNTPGGLTFVLVSTSRENPNQKIVTRWSPLETKQKKSIKEYAEVVVNHLSQKESVDGPEAFQTLYPSQRDKKEVFKKFYDEVERNREIPMPDKLGYVQGSGGNAVRNLNLDVFAGALKKLLRS